MKKIVSNITTCFFLFMSLAISSQSIRDSLLKELKTIINHSDNFDKAYPLIQKLLDKSLQLRDTQLILLSYQGLADVLWYKSFYSKAEEYYFKSLEIMDSIKYPKEYAYALYGIGWIECVQKENIEKLYLLKKSLNIYLSLKDTNHVIVLSNAISGCYSNLFQKDTTKIQFIDTAIYYIQSTINRMGLKNTGNFTQLYANLAFEYYLKNDLSKAIEIITEVEKYQNKLSRRVNINVRLIKAQILFKLKKTEPAYSALNQVWSEIDGITDNEKLKDIYKLAYQLEYYKKNYKKALEYLQKYIVVYDKINSELLMKKYEELEANKELFKKEQSILNLKKQNELHQIQDRQKNIILSIAGFSIIIISIFLYRLNIQNKKIKKLHHQVTVQRNILQQKNQDILDSINYASRIQKALITPDDFIQKHFINNQIFSEYFVLYLPKDIVSGDFYWSTTNPTHHKKPHYLAVCDCTGHGVPGAFMSLLNINYLNEAVQEKQLYYPDEILNYVRNKLIQNLSYDEQQKDGMDASLILFDKEFKDTRKIYYTLANHQLIQVRGNGMVKIHAGDKMPVGKGHYEKAFNLYTLELEKGDELYLYTDGYKDQFGGEKGKRIMHKKFIEIITTIHNQSSIEQKEYLHQFFMEWKRNQEQTDDVCIIGIKV